MPKRTKNLLMLTGLLPEAVFQDYHEMAYQAYKAFLLCIIVFATIWRLIGAYARLVHLAQSPLWDLGTGFFYVAVALPTHRVLRHQLSTHGSALALLEQMDRRGFQWESLHSSQRMCFSASVLLVAFFVYEWGSALIAENTIHQELFALRGPESTLGGVCRIAFLVLEPCCWVTTVLYITFMWVMYFFCCLHQHELLWYAEALSQTIEECVDFDPVTTLKDIEVAVSSRFRQASESWIRMTIASIAFFMGSFVWNLSVLLVIEAHEMPVIIGYLVIATVCVAALGFPLANVAETFEYDVVRALNNPVVVQRAQKYFGQQLLAHLQTLEWGFRMGGSVINVRVFSKFGVGMLLTLSGCISQAVMNRIAAI